MKDHARSVCTCTLVLLAWSRIAAADFANNELLHAHVDEVAATDPSPADRLTLTAGVLVPVLGTYRLDRKVFGSVRPSAIAFDWIAGGAVPLGLGIAALAESGHTREILGWTAVGLYAATRVGVVVIGNLHVSEYNRYLRVKLGVGTISGAF